MMFYLGLIAFDHVQHRVWIIRNVFTEGKGSLREKYDAAVREIQRTRRALEKPLPHQRRTRTAGPLRVDSNMTKAQFVGAVRKAKILHPRGRCVSNRREPALRGADERRSVRNLSRAARRESFAVSLFPEAGRCFRGRQLAGNAREGAGTRRVLSGRSPELLPRGRNEEEDRELEAKLLADPKERAEHVMLVDLGRNDLGRVCEYGSVKVERLMFVERYSHVMHLASSLRGRLARRRGLLRRADGLFPGGHAFGRARRFARWKSLTSSSRRGAGFTRGAILYLDFSGNLDSCIGLRTLVAKNGRAYVQAGAGIVADSVPEREYEESGNKARAVIKALEIAHRGGGKE